MRIIKILIIAFVLSSCQTEESKFDTIEFIGYSYIKVPARDIQHDEEWELVAPLYLHINNDYRFKYIIEKKDSGFTYIATNADEQLKALANEIVSSLDTIPGDLDLRPDGPSFNHGLELMIRINARGQNKIIHYWQHQDEYAIYQKLFNLADQMYKINSKKPLDYPALIIKSRIDLMRIAGELDSVLRPPPQLPPKDFHPLYTPPTIDPAYL